MPRRAQPWFRAATGWWCITINGKQHKLAEGRDNREAAFDRWHTLMAELAANPGVESDDHTVASVIDLYLTHVKRRCAPATVVHCTHYLQLFAEAHGFRRIRDCRPIHVTTWLDSHPEWTSDWTLNTAVNIVKRPFNWAVRQRLIAANPFAGISHRAGEPRRPMTDEEFSKLLRATKERRPEGWRRRKRPKRPTRAERFRQVLFFLRYTGARPSEMTSLTWADVNLDRAVIVLRKHKTSRTQRTPRPRVIHLVPLVVKLLRQIREQQPTSTEHVFLTARRMPWNRNSLALRMRRLRTKAGVPDDATLYGIRHQFGTQSIMNGVDLKTLAELMGHTTTRMTEHYVHLSGQSAHLAAAMQQAVGRRRDS